MAIDAGVFFPQDFASLDAGRQGRGVGRCGRDVVVRMGREAHEDKDEEQ